MQYPILENIRKNLFEKRDRINEWLQATPLGKKEVFLGPSTEQAVHTRLDAIDDAISKADSRTLGKCKVCQGEVETELLEIDYSACVCIEHFSEEERRNLESELELAQSVQKMLLPQEAPDIPGLEIAAFSRPAQIVGGDYFDFIEFRSGLHGLAIADVAGHGVSASLHMASIQALLQTLVPVNKSPSEVMSQVHRLFIHNIRFDTFVTFFIGAFDSSTKTLTYCNAGHQPPLLFRKSKSKEESAVMLRPTGAAVGLVEEAKFGEKTIDLQEGDLLVLYTDGVTEAMNTENQEFGRERLETLIRQVEGLRVIRQADFDVILCDFGMDNMNGLEIGKEIKEYCRKAGKPKIPFLLYTGLEKELDSKILNDFGIDRVVKKPIPCQDLLLLIQEITAPPAQAKRTA